MHLLTARGTRRLVVGVAVASLVAASACGRRAPDVAGVPEVVDFNFHVKPILSDRCFKCHGPDERVRKASLRLDRKEVAFGKLPSGHRAVVPGSTRRSELVARILSTDPKFMMPAPESNLSLTDYEKAVLVRWVEQGADWKPHWSLIPPKKPAVPAVRQTAWPRGDIDRFVLATLESKGLTPSPEASRETWLRRVTLDLTGLPPTLAEIDAFLADRAPDAYEKVVDRLLASPAYGERMAAEWLDVARYADSHGYQDDGMRQMWPWRDWVISAFNRNLPFDRFITWQLAGDLLPDADPGAAARDRIQPQPHADPGGRRRPRGVPDRVRRRSREHVRARVSRVERRVRAVPRPQVRPDHAEGVLSALQLLQQQQRDRPDSLFRRAEPDGAARGRCLAREARRAARRRAAAGRGDSIARNGPGYAAWLAKAAATRLPIAELPGLITYLPLDGSTHRARDDEAGARVEGAAEARRVPRLREPRARRQGRAAWRRQGPGAADRARTCRPGAAARRRQPHRDRTTSARISSATIPSPSASGCASIARARRGRS